MSADSTRPPGPGQDPGHGHDHGHGHHHHHGHDHGHGHGHGHEHEHGHGHEHGSGPAPAQPKSATPAEGIGSILPTAPRPTPPPPAPVNLDSREDAGSVALAEALRSSFVIVRVLLAALVIYFLGSGMFTVSSQERAIVLRFGVPVRVDGQIERGPGLHWAYPSPIDEVKKIPVAQLQTVQSTVGWYNVTPEQEAANIVPDAGGSLSPLTEGYAITGDGNIIHARAIIRYRITEPLKFYLNHARGTEIMTNLVDNALTFAASRYRVDDALRRDVAGFKEVVVKRLVELIAAHDLGVTVETSDVITREPRQVKADFDAVLAAEIGRSKTVSDAQSYANRVVNEARGQATARINAGETDRSRLVQAVASEAQKFTSLLPEYRKNPAFFTSRLRTETLGRVFTNAQDKFYLPLESRDQLWLHLNREAEKPVKQTLQ